MTTVLEEVVLFREAAPIAPPIGVDREKGIIRGAAIFQVGPTKDDRPWDIDQTTLQQLVELGNRPNKGTKARYTHPGQTSDGMGTHLGRYQNFRVDGDVARADLQLAKAALDRDYGKYVMDFAEEDPELFGNSPAAVLDIEAMKKTRDPKTGRMKIRLRGLHSVDVVDTPAATRSGFFSVSQDTLEAPMAAQEMTPEAPALFSAEQFHAFSSKLTAEFDAKFSALQETLANVPKQVEEARFAEQKRLAEINGLFATAGLPGEATAFFSAKPNGTLDQAREVVLEAVLKRQGGSASVGGGTNDSPAKDPDATFKAEYAKDAAFFKSKGHSEEDYILSRKIDLGLESLVPANL